MEKIKKIFFSFLLFVALMFPNSGLIINEKTIDEMEEDGDIFLGV